jgi:hypothetical protein
LQQLPCAARHRFSGFEDAHLRPHEAHEVVRREGVVGATEHQRVDLTGLRA